MDDIQQPQKQQPGHSVRNRQPSGSDAPRGSGRRKLAIVVILLMMLAVFLDSGFFSSNRRDQSASLQELDSMDAFLADMPVAQESPRSADNVAAQNKTTFSRKDDSLHVTATTLSRPESEDSPFSLTIPASSPMVAGSPPQRVGTPAAEPGIRLTGSIQPLQ